MFETELLHPEDKVDKECGIYPLRTQEIDGFRMGVTVELSIFEYVEVIKLSKPEYYEWPNWPKDRSEKEYALEILEYNDSFVRKQIKEGMNGNDIEGDELNHFWSDWGSIGIVCDFRDIPRVEAEITYENLGRGAEE